MFGGITNFFKKFRKSEKETSKSTAKERLHLVLAQDRANISADFLEMMKQEILEVIKKYIDIDEKAIDVRLTNKESEDGGVGAPALYANIPIITIKNEARKLEGSVKANKEKKEEPKQENSVSEEKTNQQQGETKPEADNNAKTETDNANENDTNSVQNSVQNAEQENATKEKIEATTNDEKNNNLESAPKNEQENTDNKTKNENHANNELKEVADEKKNN